MSRGYAWTLNNYSDEDVAELKEIATEHYVKYLAFGFETAPTTGTPHLQGMIIFKQAKKIGPARRMMPRKIAEFSSFKKAPYFNYLYCAGLTKDKEPNLFWEHGDRPKQQGKRSDIDSLYDDAKEGKTDIEIGESNPAAYMKYYKAVDRVRLNYARKRRKIETMTIIGVSGDREKILEYLHENHPDFYEIDNSGWFDGYQGQKVVYAPYGISDRYESKFGCQLPIKGGFTWKEWDTIYVNSYTRMQTGMTKDMHFE